MLIEAKGEEVKGSALKLEAGSYSFTMTGTGDADLHVKVGAEATASTYDCRPYKSGSAEACTVKVTDGQDVSVMVRGYTAATFEVVGAKR